VEFRVPWRVLYTGAAQPFVLIEEIVPELINEIPYRYGWSLSTETAEYS